MNWYHIDKQMQRFAQQLCADVKVSEDEAARLATSISADVRFLSIEKKQAIRDASPIPVEDRLEELRAFQNWMDQASTLKSNPAASRAQVLTQSYICFVYLPESCFRALAKACPSGSTAKKCAQFLSNNPVRAYRNAIAHANWTYRNDFGAIVYWAKKGHEDDAPLVRFEVEQAELEFWQALCRCVAYAAFSNL